MANLKNVFIRYFVSDERELDQRILNAVYAVGLFVASCCLVSRAVMGTNPLLLLVVALIIAAVAVLAYLSNKSRNTELWATLTVVSCCYVLLPAVFFFQGGVHTSMAPYFILGSSIIFTVKRGRQCAAFALGHVLITLVCVLVDYANPGFIMSLSGGEEYWRRVIYWDFVQTYIVVGLCIGMILRLQSHLNYLERRKSGEALVALEAAQRTTTLIFNSNPHINILLDEKLCVLDGNQAAAAYVGMESKEQLIGRILTDLNISVPEYDSNTPVGSVLERVHAVLRDGADMKFEADLCVNGEIRVAEIELKRMSYGDRYALAFYLVDVTSARKTAHELLRRDRMLEAVANAAAILASHKGSFDDAVRESMSVLAYSAEVDRVYIWQAREQEGAKKYRQVYEWINGEADQTRTVAGVTGSTDIDAVPEWEERFARGAYINGAVKTLSQAEFDMLHAFDVQSVLVLPVFLRNAFWGFLSFDDCRRERTFTESEINILQSGSLLIANAVLREEMVLKASISAARLEAVISNYSGIIWSVGTDGIMTTFNGKYLEKIGVTPAFIEGKPLNMARLKNRHFDIMDRAELAMKGEAQDWIGDIDGRPFHHQVTPLYDEAGRVIGAMGSTDDITATVEMQNDLRSAMEEAQAASRAKGDFLANMSHEIRTPLNAIIGMTTIGHTAKDAERKDYAFGKIHDASAHLLGVINDILDVSKIEAGKFELSEVPFNFERALRKVTDVLSFRVDEKGQSLMVRLDEDIPQALIGDDLHLAQIITNLLGNAVKFTPEGGSISLHAKLLSQDDETAEIQIEVTDSGIGLSEEEQGRLFQSFQQADSGTTRKYGGTGLGLVISKQIVEMMGGRIWIESEPGKGAKFAFTIRARKGVKEEAKACVCWSKVRALAVDDDAESLEYFTSIAKSLGFTCDTATGGDEALFKIKESGSYDVYFIDWKMPGMDGVELTKCIKAAGGKSVVTMMSSAEWSRFEPEAKAAGVDRFLPKPLFPSAIADCIAELLGAKAAVSNQEATVAEDSFAGRRILLAEDVEVNREIVAALLEPSGLALDMAENGAAAVALFKDNPDRYDAIFMDVQMPEMDGYEATARIRDIGTEKARTIPIVAMTANVFREDIERCLAAGMTDHVGKPLDIANVIDKLRKYLP